MFGYIFAAYFMQLLYAEYNNFSVRGQQLLLLLLLLLWLLLLLLLLLRCCFCWLLLQCIVLGDRCRQCSLGCPLAYSTPPTNVTPTHSHHPTPHTPHPSLPPTTHRPLPPPTATHPLPPPTATHPPPVHRSAGASPAVPGAGQPRQPAGGPRHAPPEVLHHHGGKHSRYARVRERQQGEGG